MSKRIMNVRNYSVDLENALAACQATGAGIKEKYLSIQDKLPQNIQQKITTLQPSTQSYHARQIQPHPGRISAVRKGHA